jgi:hypothetical protein
MINVILAVQLKPKLSIKAKPYLVFAKFAEKYVQKAGFEKHICYHCSLVFKI